MALLGMDLGGTKLASAVFSEDGNLIRKRIFPLDKRKGTDVGRLITGTITDIINSSSAEGSAINSIGISVPGISHTATGKVWAPNIPGWEDYPLLEEAESVSGDIPVVIESDRACYIMGELWQGNAKGCRDAIFLSVGTGIGAGILVNGEIMRGSHGIAGSIGWMALSKPFTEEYKSCGCFEYYASGAGIAGNAVRMISEDDEYDGFLKNIPSGEITSHEVFSAYEKGDSLASAVISQCVEFWGMAVANLISLFNPEKIIMGGGVFGPAVTLIPGIMKEASKWAQPVSINQVTIVESALAGDAGVTGAGFMALKLIRN
jgi:glucokinase